MAPGTDEAEALRAADEPAEGTQEALARTHFGKYRLHRLLARGGMGEVYLASLVGELGFEKRLVIKTILPRFAAQPRFIDLFAAEAKIAVALSHGNIVPIYELGRADDTFYIVMGYVDGPSVAELLSGYRDTRRQPEPESALHIIRGVLTGLAYAHTDEPGRPPIVHRDITPRNILIDRSGQVRIVDFGIALPAHVQVNLRAGSTGYVAPEQARAEAADPRADVFSVACLLYELLTHTPAFPREGVWVAPDLSVVPEAVRDPLERALAIDPDARPADAGAFLELLGPAFAQHASTFGDPSLAAHLRAVFPTGWSPESRKLLPSGFVAPPTKLAPKTQTFATRLTAVTSVKDEEPASVASPDRPATDPDALPQGAASAPDTSGTGRSSSLVSASMSTVPAASGSMAMATRRSPWSSILIGVAAAVVVLLIALPRMTATRMSGTHEAPALAGPVESEGPDDPPKAEPLAMDEDRPPPPTAAPVEHRRQWLEVDPPDAEVLVDGETLVGASPFEVRTEVDAVAHIIVRKAGFESKSLQWSRDTPLPERVQLGKLRPKGSGFLRVTAPTVAWAEVLVDGRKRGSTPTRSLALPAGHHRVRVRCIPDACPTERILYDKTIKIEQDTTTEVSAR